MHVKISFKENLAIPTVNATESFTGQNINGYWLYTRNPQKNKQKKYINCVINARKKQPLKFLNEIAYPMAVAPQEAAL